MDMTLPPAVLAIDCQAADRRLDRLDAEFLGVAPQTAWHEFDAVHGDIARCVGAVKGPLLALGVAWSDEDKQRAMWIHAINRRFAALGSRMVAMLERKLGPNDPRCLGAIAASLFYAGEAIKSEVTAAQPEPRRYAALHALMRSAIASGHVRREIQVEAGGRRVKCTLEALYFRALLLARFTSGNLSCRQVEVLDAWLLMWATALRGTNNRPEGDALRVDLGSEAGLSRGDEGPEEGCLYLLQKPVAAAYAGVLGQLQSGRIVPADGATAGFRVEEHIAVLDVVRRGLRRSRAAPVRAERTAASATVEIFVGLAETTARGYAEHATMETCLQLAPAGAGASVRDNSDARDNPLASIFDVRHRMGQLVNTSESGLCIEGRSDECKDISAGDLVGVRSAPGQPLQLGKVVRCVASANAGHTIIGVRRLSSTGRQAQARDASARPNAPPLQMIFVAGDDTTGRHDGYLVSEREFEKRAPLEALVGDSIFAFRFNRVRERGRGWVLAGFEIGAVRPAATQALAA